MLRTVERERSAAFTASHLAAMTVLAQIATVLGETRGLSSAGPDGPIASGPARHVRRTDDFRDALQRLPDQVADVLAREDDVAPIAREAATRRVYAVGAGPNEATATEAVIKVREAAQGWIDGLAIEQFLHGPIVSVNAGDMAVVVNMPGRAAERVSEITRVLDAIGARVWLIGQGVEGPEPAHGLPAARRCPRCSPRFSPWSPSSYWPTTWPWSKASTPTSSAATKTRLSCDAQGLTPAALASNGSW